MKNNLTTLLINETPASTPATANEVAQVEATEKEPEAIVRVINIYHFGFNDEGQLTIDYNIVGGGKGFCRAHPALKVKPIMHQEITAYLDENPKGFKLLYPAPTKAEIAEYEARKNPPKPETIKLTAEMRAYLASF